MNRRHALVTGGSGFLGRNLIELLLEQGWRVTALHRNGTNIEELVNLPITLIETELTNSDALARIFPTDLNAVFHVAGDTNMWAINNDRQYQTNVVATDVLSDVAIEKGVGRFIHTSSISAYGFHTKRINEATHSTALDSDVNYLKTKYLGELVIKNKVAQGRLDAVILNPCAIIGPYDRHNWAQLFTLIKANKLPGIPSGEGSYCHVKAIAAAHLNAFHKGRTGENYILAGVEHSFLDVTQKIAKLLDMESSIPQKTVPALVLKALGQASYLISKVTRKEPDMTPEKAMMVSERVVADCSKAVEELGYDNAIGLDKMLQDSYDWLRSAKVI